MMRSVALAAALANSIRSAVAGDVAMQLCGKTYSHKWTTKKAMPKALSDMTATTVGDAIYLIGGCGMDQTGKNTNGKFYYVCGDGLPSAISARTYEYKPSTDTYVVLPNMPRARYRHAAAAVDEKIYLLGGTNANDQIEQQIDVFDTTSATWSTLPDLFVNATTDNAAFAYDGKVYVAGGYTSDWVAQKTLWVFDPTKSGAQAWSEGPPLRHERGDFNLVLVNESAIAFGGFYDSNDVQEPLASVEQLDVGAGAAEWVTVKAMSKARGDQASAEMSGALHVIGGETKDAELRSVPLADVEVYHSKCNEWMVGGGIPSQRFRFTAASLGKMLFIFGGQGYLVGTYGSLSSKYPVLDTVEAYSETVGEPALGAASRAAAAGITALLGVAALMF